MADGALDHPALLATAVRAWGTRVVQRAEAVAQLGGRIQCRRDRVQLAGVVVALRLRLTPPSWTPEQPFLTSLVSATATAELRVMAQDWAAPTVRAEILRAVAVFRQAGTP
eukprot:13797469-Alexandrium_andersonii.AAC.1